MMGGEVLFLAHRIPFPPNKGDKIRSFHLLDHLAAKRTVHVGAFIDDPNDWQYVDQVRSRCGECHFERLSPLGARVRSLTGLLRNVALTVPYYRSAGLQRWVGDLLARRPIDRIVVFSAAMAQFVPTSTDARRILDFVDVDSDKWRQYAATKKWPLSWLYRREARLLLRYEQRQAAVFDASLFVSEQEAELFKRLAPEQEAKIGFFNNGVDAAFFSPERAYESPYAAGERALVFTGAMDYWPNVDAVEWFARAVFPDIYRRHANARFYIVGARPTDTVRDLARIPGVTVTGAVEDVRPFVRHAELCVAPLRIARGIQNKVLEAMAMAKVVIVSPQAAEGIHAIPGKEFFVTEHPGCYVELIDRLFATPATEIGLAARARVLSDYDWSRNLGVVDALLDHAETRTNVRRAPPSPRPEALSMPGGPG